MGFSIGSLSPCVAPGLGEVDIRHGSQAPRRTYTWSMLLKEAQEKMKVGFHLDVSQESHRPGALMSSCRAPIP